MKNEELYDRKILDLEREIRELKTAHYKTATTISTITKTTSVSFTLAFLDMLTMQIWSTKRAIITVTTTDSSNMISACYLKGVTASNLNNRFAYVKRLASTDGQVRFEVYVYSVNNDDFNTLYNGGTVNLSYTLEIIGSSDFTTSVSYRDIKEGSS